MSDGASSKEKVAERYQKILNLTGQILQQKAYDRVNELAQYFESEDGEMVARELRDAALLKKIGMMIRKEQEMGQCLFCEQIETPEQLFEKYRLTLYALRRLCFQLSPESQKEAFDYLRQTVPSFVAISLMIKLEIGGCPKELMQAVLECFDQKWTGEQKNIFAAIMESI